MKPTPSKPHREGLQKSKAVPGSDDQKFPQIPNQSYELPIFWCLVNALIWCQLFLPAESVGQGDLVLIHSCWFGILAIAGWGIYKFSDQPLVFDGIDLFLSLLCAGPVLSFFSMWITGGELRTGLFFVWAWLATAITVLLMRRLIPLFSIKLPVVIVLGTALLMSFLGIYQHFYFYASAEAEVLPLIENYQRAVQNLESSNNSEFARQRALEKKSAAERELSRMGVPREPHAQQMFVQRLRDSREPFGFFALANTFGGFLVLALVLAMGVVMYRAVDSSNRIQFVISIMVWVFLAYCLILTKSRTAWVGSFICLAGLLVFHIGRVKYTGIVLVKYLGAGIALILIIVGIAFWTGSLDLKVVMESSKSLTYRLDYWKSSWEMLQNHFVFGAGPGNFRQHYLEFKLPQSSEEILDPHNLWFDAWSNGGLISLIGMVGLIVFGIISLLRKNAPGNQLQSLELNSSTQSVIIVSLLSVAISGLLAPPETVRYFEETGFWILAMILSALLMNWLVKNWKIPDTVLIWAALSMVIHLHGAGGFSMPIILQLILIFAFSTRPIRPTLHVNPRLSGLLMLGTGLAMLGMSIPSVIRPRLAESVAMSKLPQTQSSSSYRRTIQEWIVIDGWNPNPWFQLSSQLRQESRQSDDPEKLQEACQMLEQAISRDPATYQYFAELAACQYEYYQRAGSRQSLDAAIESQKQAVSRYPTKPELQVQLADYFLMANRVESAKIAAAEALRLDQINHQFGHTDRYLDEIQLKLLQEIMETAGSVPTS
ncbi:MAG TPA: hypothetical protein DD473_26120 [Planctomycetaceae bacterium]|nr:hypothetical protein [Planctomycetaceae bacterium]